MLHSASFPTMIPFPNISPIAFSIKGFHIHWYGIAYVLSIYLGIKQANYLAKKYNAFNLAKNITIEDATSYMVLGILLGGRLGYILFYDLAYYLTFPMKILKVWEGGMAFHGGMIGALIGLWLFSKKVKRPFLAIADLGSAVGPIAGILIRAANFINGELYGRPTNVPWGMIFPNSDGIIRHPSQLYEMFFEGIVLYIITNISYAKKHTQKGFTTGMVLLGYGVFRFLIEFFRDPADGFVGIFTKGQALCIPMVIMGIWLIYRAFKNK